MKKKVFALLLAFSMLAALAACGGDSGSASPSPSGSAPEQSPAQSPEAGNSPEPAQGGDVDLQKFYEDLLVKYEGDDFNPNMAVEGDFLTSCYGGLADIPVKQQVIYQPMMSSVVCEIALVEVEDAGDVQKVEDVFQARIDAQVGTDDAPGGAWYPESIEGWKNNSRIVSVGNYVMMIAWEKCDEIVGNFSALFE